MSSQSDKDILDRLGGKVCSREKSECRELLEKYPDGDCRLKIYRGGHWGSSFEQVRAASRVGLGMEIKSDNIGLRIVRTLQ